MPYKVVRVRGGYKVKNRITGRAYSKHAQTKSMALKQLAALQIHAPDHSQDSTHPETFAHPVLTLAHNLNVIGRDFKRSVRLAVRRRPGGGHRVVRTAKPVPKKKASGPTLLQALKAKFFPPKPRPKPKPAPAPAPPPRPAAASPVPPSPKPAAAPAAPPKPAPAAFPPKPAPTGAGSQCGAGPPFQKGNTCGQLRGKGKSAPKAKAHTPATVPTAVPHKVYRHRQGVTGDPKANGFYIEPEAGGPPVHLGYEWAEAKANLNKIKAARRREGLPELPITDERGEQLADENPLEQ